MTVYSGPSPLSKIVTNGLITYVDFGQDLSYRENVKPVATDLSYNSKNATITGFPTITNEFGGGLLGNATFPNLNMTTGPNLNIPGAFTVMLWTKSPSSAYGNFVFPLRFNSGDIAIGILVGSVSGRIFDGGGQEVSLQIASNISTNTIYHWAFSYNGVTSFKTYSQGTLQNSFGPFSITPSVRNAPNFSFNLGYNYPGTLYSAMVYNRQLTDAEVTQNFNAHRSRFGV